jgi:hypothetical protein
VEEHQDRLFQIHAETQTDFQELVNILRTMTNLQQLSVDPQATTLHAIAAKGEIAAAEATRWAGF